jgi:hypothetical protein
VRGGFISKYSEIKTHFFVLRRHAADAYKTTKTMTNQSRAVKSFGRLGAYGYCWKTVVDRGWEERGEQRRNNVKY